MKPIMLVALAPLVLAACNDMPSKPQPVVSGNAAAAMPAPSASSTGVAPPAGLTSGSLGDAAVPPGTQGPPPPAPMARDDAQQPPPPPAVHREEQPPPPPPAHEETEQQH